MSIRPALMIIADIGGYTRFMNWHRMSLAHAHEIIAKLLESIIDAARGLTLAKLEGDAAFFYSTHDSINDVKAGFVNDQLARIYSAFHHQVAELLSCNICPCDACTQVGNLKIKFTGHFGEVAVHRVKRMTELAGVDVILVHRLLKNSVPIPEYLLMTEPVLGCLNGELRRQAESIPTEVDDLGKVNTYFVDVAGLAGQIVLKPRRSWPKRLYLGLARDFRTLPMMVGLRKPCVGYRNVPAANMGP